MIYKAARVMLVLLGLVLGCSDDQPVRDADAGAKSTDAGMEQESAGWRTLEDTPSGPIQETATVALDGRIYVLGGIDGARQTLRSVLVYDFKSGEWLKGAAPDLPIAAHHVNAAVAEGTLYVTGALLADFAPTGDVWSWRPGESRWRERTAMRADRARGASAVSVVGGRIYVAGGLGSGGRSVDAFSSYDPEADRWDDTLPSLPASLDHVAGQSVGDVFFVLGGRTNGITNVKDAVYAFADGAWRERAAMPTARGGCASGVIDGTIVVVGGEGNSSATSGVFDQVERYDPEADRWSVLPAMPRPRHGMAAVGVGKTLYVPGGADQMGFGAVATFDALTVE